MGLCALLPHHTHVKVRGHFTEVLTTFHYVGSKNQTWFLRLSGKHLYLLSHLANHKTLLIKLFSLDFFKPQPEKEPNIKLLKEAPGIFHYEYIPPIIDFINKIKKTVEKRGKLLW